MLAPITTKEFSLFKAFIYQKAGINLADNKHLLVSGRLAKRLKHYGLSSYELYYKLILSGTYPEENQIAIDLLTTNETHFFREPKHFAFLKDQVELKETKGKSVRVWSAASSSGEEPYTIAMILAEVMGDGSWEVIGSDISSKVLTQAQTGLYPISRAEEIPRQYLEKFCLKGTGTDSNKLLITQELRKRVRFMYVNLMESFPLTGDFDFIFLRNVMIYFDMDKKRQILQKIIPLLKKDGYLFIGHSETLNGITNLMTSVAPAIYQKI